MDYVIWDHSGDETLCSLNNIQNLPDAHELCYGVSKIKNYPSDVYFDMDPELKRAIKLSDALDNRNFIIVASPELVKFFKDHELKSVEYLPVTVYNHKKQVASAEYSIVNQVGTQNCIDLEQSKIKWNKINPEQISSVKRLIIDEAKVDPNIHLFRAKHLTSAIFIKRELAEEIERTGFTGIEFIEINSYRKV